MTADNNRLFDSGLDMERMMAPKKSMEPIALLDLQDINAEVFEPIRPPELVFVVGPKDVDPNGNLISKEYLEADKFREAVRDRLDNRLVQITDQDGRTGFAYYVGPLDGREDDTNLCLRVETGKLTERQDADPKYIKRQIKKGGQHSAIQATEIIEEELIEAKLRIANGEVWEGAAQRAYEIAEKTGQNLTVGEVGKTTLTSNLVLETTSTLHFAKGKLAETARKISLNDLPNRILKTEGVTAASMREEESKVEKSVKSAAHTAAQIPLGPAVAQVVGAPQPVDISPILTASSVVTGSTIEAKHNTVVQKSTHLSEMGSGRIAVTISSGVLTTVILTACGGTSSLAPISTATEQPVITDSTEIVAPPTDTINGIPTADLNRVGSNCPANKVVEVMTLGYGAGEYDADEKGVGQTVVTLSNAGFEQTTGFSPDKTGVDEEIQAELIAEIQKIISTNPGSKTIVIPEYLNIDQVKAALGGQVLINIVSYSPNMDMTGDNTLLVAPHVGHGGRRAIEIWKNPVKSERTDGSALIRGTMMKVIPNKLNGTPELWSIPGQDIENSHADVAISNGCDPLIVRVTDGGIVTGILASGDLDTSMMTDESKVWIKSSKTEVVQNPPTATVVEASPTPATKEISNNGPDQSQVDKVLREANVEFPETLDTHYQDQSYAFDLRISKELVKYSGINKAQFPESMAQRWAYQALGRLYMSIYDTQPGFTEFAEVANMINNQTFPAETGTTILQDKAKAAVADGKLDNDITIGKVHGKLNAIEIDLVKENEFDTLVSGFQSNNIETSMRPEFDNDYYKKLGRNVAVFFTKEGKLTIIAYDNGANNNERYDTHSPVLAYAPKGLANDFLYNSILLDYRRAMDYIEIIVRNSGYGPFNYGYGEQRSICPIPVDNPNACTDELNKAFTP